MPSFLVFHPRTGTETLVEYLEDTARLGHRVHLPDDGPGVLETNDPLAHLRSIPDKIRLHMVKHEWDVQLRFYSIGDLDIPSAVLSACGDLGIGISVWRTNAEPL